MLEVIFIFFIFSSHALTQSEAVALSKSRLKTLSPWVGQLSHACRVYEEDCQLQSKSQKATLQWISSELAQSGPPIIDFSDDNKQFMIDGALRIAKTGNTRGSPIIFNENLLVRKQLNEEYSALGLFECIAILIHELGHHQDNFFIATGLPVLHHEELDVIGALVTEYLKDRTRVISIPAKTHPQSIYPTDIYIIDYEHYNGVRNIYSYVFYDNSQTVTEISQFLTQTLSCPINYDKYGKIAFKGQAQQVAMKNVKAPEIRISAQGVQIKQFVGTASVFCVDFFLSQYEVVSGYKNGELQIELLIDGDGFLHFLRDRSFFEATPPPGKHYF